MPVFTNPISSQNTSYQAGIHSYPNIGQTQQYSISMDEFLRETLQPTNSYNLYTVNAASTGTATITSQKQLFLDTAVTQNDYVGVRTSGLSFNRNSSSIQLDSRSNIIFDIFFSINQTTTTQLFIGFLAQGTALTALPTTNRHFGVYVDTTVNANLWLSSANGTTQVKTDTGVTYVANTEYRFNCIWNGNDTATMNLFSGQASNSLDISVLSKTVSVTSFLNGITTLPTELYLWVKTLSATSVASAFNCYGWKVQAT